MMQMYEPCYRMRDAHTGRARKIDARGSGGEEDGRKWGLMTSREETKPASHPMQYDAMMMVLICTERHSRRGKEGRKGERMYTKLFFLNNLGCYQMTCMGCIQLPLIYFVGFWAPLRTQAAIPPFLQQSLISFYVLHAFFHVLHR